MLRDPQKRPRTIAMARPGSGAAAGTDSTTSTWPKRSTSSCATSAAWAGSSRSSGAAGRGTDARRGQDIRVTVKLTLQRGRAPGSRDRQAQDASSAAHTCQGTGAKAGTRPVDLLDLRRQRRGAPRHPQHVRPVRLGVALPDLRRRGHRHRRSVRGVPGRRAGSRRAHGHGRRAGRRVRQQLPHAARARRRRPAQRSRTATCSSCSTSRTTSVSSARATI